MTAHCVVAAGALTLWQRIEAFLSVSTIELLVGIATRWEHWVCLDATSGPSLRCGASLGDRDPTWRVHAHPIINWTTISIVWLSVLALWHAIVLLGHHTSWSIDHSYWATLTWATHMLSVVVVALFCFVVIFVSFFIRSVVVPTFILTTICLRLALHWRPCWLVVVIKSIRISHRALSSWRSLAWDALD